MSVSSSVFRDRLDAIVPLIYDPEKTERSNVSVAIRLIEEIDRAVDEKFKNDKTN